MISIIRGRQQGKTTELIKQCAEHGGYIVVQDQPEAYQLASLARSLNLNIPFPITYHDLVFGNLHAPGIRTVWIENADRFMEWCASYLGGVALGGYTLTPGDPPPPTTKDELEMLRRLQVISEMQFKARQADGTP